jgi:hypothetical protein
MSTPNPITPEALNLLVSQASQADSSFSFLSIQDLNSVNRVSKGFSLIFSEALAVRKEKRLATGLLRQVLTASPEALGKFLAHSSPQPEKRINHKKQ